MLELLNQRGAERPKVTRFPVRTNERTTFIKVSAVDWIEAAGNYVILHVGKETPILRHTLAALEEQLRTNFTPVSRSEVVNFERVREHPKMPARYPVLLLQCVAQYASHQYIHLMMRCGGLSTK